MKSDIQRARPRFYTPNEVSMHNTASDIWVSFLGHVYDLTKLIDEYNGSCDTNLADIETTLTMFGPFLGDILLKPIIDVAGLDISHWFDSRTRDVSIHRCNDTSLVFTVSIIVNSSDAQR
jgi:hypothetical protein